MSFLSDVGDFVGDVVDTAVDVVDAVSDVAEAAAPFVMAVNPAMGLALQGFSQVENAAEPFLNKLTGGSDKKSGVWSGPHIIGGKLPCGTSGGGGAGSLAIEPGDSLATILAKVFGAQLNEKEDKVRSLATEGTGGEDASSRNALIGAAVADLTNLSSIAGKTIDAVKDAQNSALGRG